MKIYIVTDGIYSDYHIEAVFTTRENAERYAAIHSCSYIEEYEADAEQIQGNIDIYVIHKFDVYKKGDFYLDTHYYSDKKITEVRKGWFSRNAEIYVSLDKFDEEKAEKIAQDMYAQWKYEQIEKGGE